MSLRVRNFNIDDKTRIVCLGKGGKSRRLPLPEAAINEINNQMCYMRNLQKLISSRFTKEHYCPSKLNQNHLLQVGNYFIFELVNMNGFY
jgi:integrase